MALSPPRPATPGGWRVTLFPLLCAALLLGLWAGPSLVADAHGFLLAPLSRNIQSYYNDPSATKDYTPQGLNAGGKSV